MKQSVWLQNYEASLNAKKEAGNSKKIIIPITILVMMGLGLVASISNGGLEDPQARSGMIGFIGLFVGILLFSVLMIMVGKKKDGTKYTRKEVMALFQCDADVDQFDQEMSAAPLKDIVINAGTNMFLTESYVGVKSTAFGNLDYSFIRNQDIASFHRIKTKSTTANPLQAAYLFDIRNTENKVIMNGLADSGKQLDAIIELLQAAKPDVTLA